RPRPRPGGGRRPAHRRAALRPDRRDHAGRARRARRRGRLRREGEVHPASERRRGRTRPSSEAQPSEPERRAAARRRSTMIEGLFCWDQFAPRFNYDFHGTYVEEGRIAIDPVEPNDVVLARLLAAGVDRIVLTNRNHFRAAAKLREATG